MKTINRTYIHSYAIVLLALIMSLSACSKAPGCADEATVSLVQNIAMDRMRDILTTRYSPYAAEVTYAFFQEQISKGATHLESVIKKVDADISKMHIEVEGIRVVPQIW